MKSYFITGTDTNVGKTYVSTALARRAVALGHKVFAFKPIETGCATGPDGQYIGADQELLAAAAGDWQRGPLRGLYRFQLPAAPLVSATAESATIDLDFIARTTIAAASQHAVSLTLVEGAGGWRVPITPSADMSTLARALFFPVILVARAALGTINHTLLSIEAILRDGLFIAAVILSRRPEDDLADSNLEQIARIWPGQILMLESDLSHLDLLL
jgi:dethiobiotin synthetase